MNATGAPRQGDHVFNILAEALLRPFATIRAFGAAQGELAHFVDDYLLHTYSVVAGMAASPGLLAARELSASGGAEENALRELAGMRARFPALAGIHAARLREVHAQNATQFGAAVTRFESEFLRKVQSALEAILHPAAARPVGALTPSPGIACQQLLGAAFDPAAALALIVNEMSRETAGMQGAFHATVAAIADSLDRPGMWREPYNNFREERPSATGRMIIAIRDGLAQIDQLQGQASSVSMLIDGDMANYGRLRRNEGLFGMMLHQLQTRLQQMRG